MHVSSGRSIETDDAMAVPGVVTFVSAEDIPGSNKTGPAVYDETVLADDKVTFMTYKRRPELIHAGIWNNDVDLCTVRFIVCHWMITVHMACMAMPLTAERKERRIDRQEVCKRSSL